MRLGRLSILVTAMGLFIFGCEQDPANYKNLKRPGAAAEKDSQSQDVLSTWDGMSHKGNTLYQLHSLPKTGG